MTNGKKILQFLYDRLFHLYKENENKDNYQELPGMANLTSMTLEVSTWKAEDSWTKPEKVKK